jgi:hypothetical protein
MNWLNTYIHDKKKSRESNDNFNIEEEKKQNECKKTGNYLINTLHQETKLNSSFDAILKQLWDPDKFPSYEETHNNKEYDKACFEYRLGKINKNDFEKIHNTFQKNKKIINCNNIQEFEAIVNILPLWDQRKKYYINHEMAHAKIAEKYNLKYSYQVMFSKVPKWQEGWFHITPAVVVNYPENLSFEEYSKIFLEITSDPEELSENDKNQIQTLKNIK